MWVISGHNGGLPPSMSTRRSNPPLLCAREARLQQQILSTPTCFAVLRASSSAGAAHIPILIRPEWQAHVTQPAPMGAAGIDFPCSLPDT